MLLNRGAEIPDYDGVRTARYTYVEYATGERELYDLRHDPDEVHNLAGTRPALERRLGRRIAQLRRCGGRGCRRSRTGRSPTDPSRRTGMRLDVPRRRAATMRSLR